MRDLSFLLSSPAVLQQVQGGGEGRGEGGGRGGEEGGGGEGRSGGMEEEGR